MENIYNLLTEYILEWNEKINVISRKDIDNVFEHHILHSLCIAFYLESECPEIFADWVKGGVTVLDVGCGGGFPGIPLKILYPGLKVPLFDSFTADLSILDSLCLLCFSIELSACNPFFI